MFNLLCIAGLEQLMTLEEKAKLYAAIGYSETAVDPTLPKSVRYKHNVKQRLFLY